MTNCSTTAGTNNLLPVTLSSQPGGQEKYKDDIKQDVIITQEGSGFALIIADASTLCLQFGMHPIHPDFTFLFVIFQSKYQLLLFLKYYSDVNKFNLLISLIVLITGQSLPVSIISFCSVGMVASFIIYRYYYNIQYYFYANAGLSRNKLMLQVGAVNAILSTLILLIIR